MNPIGGAVKGLFKTVDKWLVIFSVICSSFGVVLIYSATRNTQSGTRNVAIQGFSILAGVILMFIISRVDYEFFEDIASIIFIFFVIALIATYFVATPIKGNRNWINLGIINIQTSEIAKVAFIITFSTHIYRLGGEINKLRNAFFLLLHFLFYLVPILMQGDAGSALIYFVMFIVMLFVGGLKPVYFTGAAVVLGASTPLIWNFVLKDYMKNRILVTFSPEIDPLGSGYQAIQSKIALGSGGLTGSGLFKGIQTQYNLLPEKHTDFIFSVAGEELGFIGCMLIIFLLCIIIFRIGWIGAASKNEAGLLICTGVAAMLAAQMIENIGMCVGLLPVIGITLPFFSYGGSSLISVFCALGLALSVFAHSRGLSFSDEP